MPDLYAFRCRACCIHRWASGRDVVCSQCLLHILLHIDIRASTERDKIFIPRQSLTYLPLRSPDERTAQGLRAERQCNGDREMRDVDGQDYNFSFHASERVRVTQQKKLAVGALAKY
jgi:hypothetical protein